MFFTRDRNVKNNMEEADLTVSPQSKLPRMTWRVFFEELKKVSRIAAPMVAVAVLQYLLQVISVMMVGHLGSLVLSSVAIATSLTNVTGFSLLSGLVGGLETLCGQAYGAQQFKKVGVYTYSAIISLTLVCFPICVLWVFMDKFLVLLGQDPSIAHEARKYSIWLIPALFANAVTKPLVRYLQSQSLTLPMMITSSVVLCFHVPVSWVFIFKLKLGSVGAAIAFCLSNGLYLVLLLLYARWSPSCDKTHSPFSLDAFLHIREFFKYAIPSAVMVCLKWWSLEVLVLVSGLLHNPALETSVLSICLTISTLNFTIAYGLGAGASTRVSNELGGGNAAAARVAARAAMFLAVTETVIVSITLFVCRHLVGRAYSNEMEVVNYMSEMVPLICLSFVTDSLQAVISGIARGSGWQIIGAYVNLAAFYLFGIPIAVVLGFPVHLRAKGLWIGIVVGSVVQSSLFSLVLAFTNWQKQANKAKERVSTKQQDEISEHSASNAQQKHTPPT